jgi:hypothetical protein
MSATVDDLHLSFLWTETFDLLLREPQPAVPYQRLGRSYSYRALFEEIVQGEGPEGLEPPWQLEFAPKFWRYYGERQFGAIPPVQAWSRLVPILVRIPFRVTSADVAEPLAVYGYLHPFAVSVEISTRIPGGNAAGLETEAAIALARQLYSGELNVANGNGAPTRRRLNPLANDALRWLRTMVLGSPEVVGTGPAAPFSVATFVRISGIDPGKPTDPGGPVHRTVEALATWSPDWKKSGLRDLKGRAAEILSRAPPGHLLFADKRARVGWLPSEAFPEDPMNERFMSYHRHQVSAILQLEALGCFIKGVAQRIAEGKRLWVAEEECARHASGILGRLYGAKDTYRSDSCRLYLEQNDLVGPVNAVRARFGQDKLHRGKESPK